MSLNPSSSRLQRLRRRCRLPCCSSQAGSDPVRLYHRDRTLHLLRSARAFDEPFDSPNDRRSFSYYIRCELGEGSRSSHKPCSALPSRVSSAYSTAGRAETKHAYECCHSHSPALFSFPRKSSISLCLPILKLYYLSHVRTLLAAFFRVVPVHDLLSTRSRYVLRWNLALSTLDCKISCINTKAISCRS